jgi:hypothetical protein
MQHMDNTPLQPFPKVGEDAHRVGGVILTTTISVGLLMNLAQHISRFQNVENLTSEEFDSSDQQIYQ